MLAGIRWGAFMSLLWAVAAVVVSTFSAERRFRVGAVVLSASLSHLWAAIHAAFDFFDIKLDIAKTLEAAADSHRDPKDKLNPGQGDDPVDL